MVTDFISIIAVSSIARHFEESRSEALKDTPPSLQDCVVPALSRTSVAATANSNSTDNTSISTSTISGSSSGADTVLGLLSNYPPTVQQSTLRDKLGLLSNYPPTVQQSTLRDNRNEFVIPKPPPEIMSIPLGSLLIWNGTCLPSIPHLLGQGLMMNTGIVQVRLIQYAVSAKTLPFVYTAVGKKKLATFLRSEGIRVSRSADVTNIMAQYQQTRLGQMVVNVPPEVTHASISTTDPTRLVSQLFEQIHGGFIRTQLRELYLLLLAYHLTPNQTVRDLLIAIDLGQTRYINAALSFILQLLKLSPEDMDECITILGKQYKCKIPVGKFGFLASSLRETLWRELLVASGPSV